MVDWRVRLKIEPHEWLWTVRVRLGFNQEEMAAHMGTSRGHYQILESGEGPMTVYASDDRDAPDPSIILRLCRRRSGMTTRQAAQRFGVSRARFHALERRGSRRLFEFWKKNKHARWLAEAFTEHFDCPK